MEVPSSMVGGDIIVSHIIIITVNHVIVMCMVISGLYMVCAGGSMVICLQGKPVASHIDGVCRERFSLEPDSNISAQNSQFADQTQSPIFAIPN